MSLAAAKLCPAAVGGVCASGTIVVIAGLLVGIGTRIGGGCTSGQGVIGLSRLSSRSLVATITFMLGGFVTVYVINHLSVRMTS